ncbi:41198_t:CDS:2, partial [Gigaspora margarita]
TTTAAPIKAEEITIVLANTTSNTTAASVARTTTAPKQLNTAPSEVIGSTNAALI